MLSLEFTNFNILAKLDIVAFNYQVNALCFV